MTKEGGQLRVTGLATVCQQMNNSCPTSSHPWTEALRALPESLSWVIGNVYGEQHSKVVARALRNGTATAVSNGSYKEGLGSSATIIHGDKRTTGIVVTNHVQGLTIYQLAYRSELAGCLASLITTKVICQLHNVAAGSVTIGLDSQEAI